MLSAGEMCFLVVQDAAIVCTQSKQEHGKSCVTVGERLRILWDDASTHSVEGPCLDTVPREEEDHGQAKLSPNVSFPLLMMSLLKVVQTM